MKMNNWKFYENNNNTWRITTKKGIVRESNIDIIVTKNVERDKIEVTFLEFNMNLSDHR